MGNGNGLKGEAGREGLHLFHLVGTGNEHEANLNKLSSLFQERLLSVHPPGDGPIRQERFSFLTEGGEGAFFDMDTREGEAVNRLFEEESAFPRLDQEKLGLGTEDLPGEGGKASAGTDARVLDRKWLSPKGLPV